MRIGTLPADLLPVADEMDHPSRLLGVVVDKLPAMVAYWDTSLKCRFANRAYEKWFGVKPESMLGMPMRELLGPLFALNLPYIEGALRGEEQEFEREIPDPAGGASRHSFAHYIPDIVDGTVRGFCVLVTDITRLKQAEEALLRVEHQLQATERFAAMATLAAGVAHEINNPLAAVLANVEATLEALACEPLHAPRLREMLVDSREAALRIRGIVQSMKLLARGDTTEHELVDVAETLEQSIVLASNLLRHRARLVRELGKVGHIEGNANQLTQLFVNLLVNAAQALPDDNPTNNEIRVSSRRDQDRIVIEVADNGRGIPEELQERIFEPFFTTKGVGAGMGLGLSISSAIVQAFGGVISVRSKPGRGSVFRVVFPAARAPAPSSTPLALLARGDDARAATPARMRVLVIDDDEVVAKTLQRVLADTFDVVTLTRGRDAIDLLTAAPTPNFDVILCDVMMPEVDGERVFTAVGTRHPELKRQFVFMTGGAFTERTRAFLDGVDRPLIEKPFELAQLRGLLLEQGLRRDARP